MDRIDWMLYALLRAQSKKAAKEYRRFCRRAEKKEGV